MFMRLFFTITVQWLVRQRHPVKCCVPIISLHVKVSWVKKRKREKNLSIVDTGWVAIMSGGLGINFFHACPPDRFFPQVFSGLKPHSRIISQTKSIFISFICQAVCIESWLSYLYKKKGLSCDGKRNISYEWPVFTLVNICFTAISDGFQLHEFSRKTSVLSFGWYWNFWTNP